MAVLGLRFCARAFFSLVVASGGHSSSRCAGPLIIAASLVAGAQAPDAHAQQLWLTGSRAHGLSCSAACGILPDQGSNPCPPHRQADSQPLRHQGSPTTLL